MIEDDNHDKLIKAFIDYSKANERWDHKRTYRRYQKVQQELRKVRSLIKVRLDENLDYFKNHVQGTKNQKQEGDE
jgi:hypothetical protein